MDWQNEKCVMVIDESLSSGMIANMAAIMGITLGKKRLEVVGKDVSAGLSGFNGDGNATNGCLTESRRWWRCNCCFCYNIAIKSAGGFIYEYCRSNPESEKIQRDNPGRAC